MLQRFPVSTALLALVALNSATVSQAGPDSEFSTSKNSRIAPSRNTATRSASISGQAFVITISGRVTFAARARVSLIPATPATRELYDRFGKTGQRLPARELQFSPLAKTVSADEEGRFEFTGLAPGDYYLVSHLTPGFHTGLAMHHGGLILHNQASVRAGESVKLQLTAQVQPGIGFH